MTLKCRAMTLMICEMPHGDPAHGNSIATPHDLTADEFKMPRDDLKIPFDDLKLPRDDLDMPRDYWSDAIWRPSARKFHTKPL